MDPSPSDLERIHELYGRGLYLQAYEVAKASGPLRAWKGTAARLIGGRLAYHLGAPRLARWLHHLARKDDRAHFEALYYYTRSVLDRRGPLAAWEIFRSTPDLPGAAAEIRADWFSLRAGVAAVVRDFDTAEHWLDVADRTAPDRPWTCIERSHVLELEDRYEESLAAARRSLELRPWYRPGVQSAAHMLQLLDRDAEALDLLREAAARLESGPVWSHLASILTEMERHAEARDAYERVAALSPLLEDEVARWLNARRCDVACWLGDYPAASEFARSAGGSYYGPLAERLASGAPGRRVLLPVGFVRQHHMTCAPATLSALSRFWSRPAEHLELAEVICYDGTPAHSERTWAEQNGFIAREFTVTWEAAVDLIDRGVPFTITTVEPGNAHLQALIGYDERRRTVVFRDPYERHWQEWPEAEFFKRQASMGPRGMTLLPAGERARLAGADLPEARFHDLLHEIQRALMEHDRPRAAKALQTLAVEAGDHRLHHHARRALAAYDHDRLSALDASRRLLELQPGEPLHRLGVLANLRDLAHRDERLRLLKESAEEKDAHPLFWQLYAQELSGDARRHDEAVRLLRRTLAAMPRHAASLHTLANVLWSRRRLTEACELYRFAACVEDKDEEYAAAYFVASRHLGRTDETLAFLRGRFRRFGRRSSHPARTLAWACEQLELQHEALHVLDEAVALRPDDGDLLLAAADTRARMGDAAGADLLLERARGRAKDSVWTRARARLAQYGGRLSEALDLWRGVLDLEPLAMDAHASAADLLSETEGRAAAAAHLRAAVERFPHHGALRRHLVEWLHGGDPADLEAAVRELIAMQPDDAWAHRELAIVLGRMSRWDEALAAAADAQRLEPASPWSWAVRGHLRLRSGRLQEAKADSKTAVRLGADTEGAILDLVHACRSDAERLEALAFVRLELARQVTFGDGIRTWRELARETYEPDQLLASLMELLRARPDLWQAWNAVVHQLAEMGRLEEAAEQSRQAVERFPLIPLLWLDAAMVARLRQDAAAEIDGLRQAMAINPTWGPAIRELAAALGRRGDFDAVRRVLEQAAARSPTDPDYQSMLAAVLWKTGDRARAVARAEAAVRLSPGHDGAWEQLTEWSRAAGDPGRPAKVAREIADARPRDPRAWMALARTIEGADHLAERMEAIDRALALDPALVEAHDHKASMLALAGRADEALAACRPAGFGDEIPLPLRGRAAWVRAVRGDLSGALAAMKEILARESHYGWGWMQVADWARRLDRASDFSEAARMMVRLDPGSVLARSYLADALLRSGDRPAAKEEFARALEYDPEHLVSAARLFDLRLEDGELDAAEAALAPMRTHHGGTPAALSREARLHAARHRHADAGPQFEALARHPDADDAIFLEAEQPFVDGGRADVAVAAYRGALKDPAANPLTAARIVRLLAAQKKWKEAETEVAALAPDGEPRWQAAAMLAETAAEADQAGLALRTIERDRALLNKPTVAWARVGYAFSALRRYPQAAEWLADWKGRSGLEAWMLLNHSVALRQLHRIREAHQVSQAAVALPPGPATPFHDILLSLDHGLAGEADPARERLEQVDAAGLNPEFKFLLALARALGEPGFSEAATRVAEAVRTHPNYREDAMLRHAYLAVIGRIRPRGGWRGRLWWAWRWLTG